MIDSNYLGAKIRQYIICCVFLLEKVVFCVFLLGIEIGGKFNFKYFMSQYCAVKASIRRT